MDRYTNRDEDTIVIKDMHDSHLINSHLYFIKKRAEARARNASSKKILSMSILIAFIEEEIDRRGILI